MAKFKDANDYFDSLENELENETPNISDKDVEDIDDLLNEEEDKEEKESEVELDTEEDVEEEAEDEEPSEEEKEDVEEDDDIEVEKEEGEEKVSEEDDDGIVFEDEEVVEGQISYESLATEMGFENVSDKKSFIESYKLSLEKAKEDALGDVPKDLKEAVAFAKEGGDYQAFLNVASSNYDEVSNEELVELSMEKYFKGEDGKVDVESLREFMDSKSSAEINMMGDQLRDKLKAEQKFKLEKIRNDASREKAESDRKLKEYIDSTKSIGGVRLKDSDKESLYNDAVTGEAVRELFYDEGKLSQKKVVEALFMKRNFEKAIALAKTSSKQEGKRQVLKGATNSTVKRRSQKPEPKVKKESPIDSVMNYFKERK